ncbi:MAG: transketolase family protein [Clostridia bacterium]|nr:transketolase family protein [Clostridia bacterium]MBR3838220.1 transketolase family protein [Clostridia bacterium]
MGKVATREAYGAALAQYGADTNIIVLDADLSKSTKTDTFRKVFPERHFNMGIAEANMMSVAAGLATTGKVVFASTFAMFASERACEQIRNSICYPKLNVKIGATHAGLTVGEDGASHQCVEDLAVMRALPNMVVLSPCDEVETNLAIKAAIDHDGPVYIRLGRLAVEAVHDAETFKFELGKGVQIKEGNDLTIVATGLMVQESLKAAELLAAKGINARVIDMHTIKPIDKDILAKASKETGFIVTVEEHNVTGGLGGAVCEAICDTAPCKVLRIGVEEKYGKSGTPAALLEKYGLTAQAICDKITAAYKGE